jgi:hypothetical protein
VRSQVQAFRDNNSALDYVLLNIRIAGEGAVFDHKHQRGVAWVEFIVGRKC